MVTVMSGDAPDSRAGLGTRQPHASCSYTATHPLTSLDHSSTMASSSAPNNDSGMLGIGQQCEHPTCMMVDFLPFACSHCSRKYVRRLRALFYRLNALCSVWSTSSPKRTAAPRTTPQRTTASHQTARCAAPPSPSHRARTPTRAWSATLRRSAPSSSARSAGSARRRARCPCAGQRAAARSSLRPSSAR